MNPENSTQTGPQKNVAMALLCYLGILVIVPLLTEAKNDPFVKFHIKQGLVLVITWIIVGAIRMIPVIGYMFLGPILGLVCLVLAIVGIVNAVGGKEKALPLIGHYAEKISL